MSDIYADEEAAKAQDVAVPLDAALVTAFWTYARLAHSPDRAERSQAEESYWASHAVNVAVRNRVHGAVAIIVSLAEAVEGDLQCLEYLAAGPVEDLLRCGYPPPTTAMLDELDAAMQTSENVRRAVGAVWWGPDDDPQTVSRFESLRDSYP